MLAAADSRCADKARAVVEEAHQLSWTQQVAHDVGAPTSPAGEWLTPPDVALRLLRLHRDR